MLVGLFLSSLSLPPPLFPFTFMTSSHASLITIVSPDDPLPSEWLLEGLKVSSGEAALTTLSQLCSEFDSARDQCRLAQEQLREKKSRIDKFAEVVVSFKLWCVCHSMGF